MAVEIMKERPPFVRFEQVESNQIDQAATEAAGYPIPVMVDMAIVTPIGSKDEFHKPALDFLAEKKQQAMAGRVQLEWVNQWQAQYDEWKKGNELPRDGTPLKTWPCLTNMQKKPILAAGIYTVEDLASWPDTYLDKLGMGGRYARDTAKAWVQEAQGTGANAKRMADLEALIREQATALQIANEKIKELDAALPKEQKRERQKPEKVAA